LDHRWSYLCLYLEQRCQPGTLIQHIPILLIFRTHIICLSLPRFLNPVENTLPSQWLLHIYHSVIDGYGICAIFIFWN
jgi:hypothetical protein